MTILTTNLIIKKTPPNPIRTCEEGVVQVQPERVRTRVRQHSLSALLTLLILAVAVAVAGLICGLMLYRQYLRSSVVHRYQGFCSIPIPKQDPQLLEPSLRLVPLRWAPQSEVQVVSLLGEDPSDELVNTLREELDIGGNVEKISVFDNGRRVNFTHDFEANFTGIMDADRCFLTDLDPEVVEAPSTFVLGISRAEKFDVSRVRSSLRASLPPLRDLADLADLARGLSAFLNSCLNRPTYRLHKEDGVIIRKRSAEEPPHDYIQFSGKHIQEIEITNLHELRHHEESSRQGQ